jgi:hypothetical protein
MNKNFGIALAVILALVGVGTAYHALTVANQNGVTLESLLGASTLHSFFEQFVSGLETSAVINGNGGVETLTAAATTTTLTANQLCSGKVIVWAPTTNNSTGTLPTTASLVNACLPKAGMFLDFELRNTAAANTFNVVAGTGQTFFHIMETATATSQGTTITSSTPTWYRLRITLASGTDSTASLFQTKYLAP